MVPFSSQIFATTGKFEPILKGVDKKRGYD